MLNTKQTSALYILYPQVVKTIGDVAYDKDDNAVAYDVNSVIAKATEIEQAATDAKTSALAKLTALGLTSDEIKALLG
jgi:hypothetical protein